IVSRHCSISDKEWVDERFDCFSGNDKSTLPATVAGSVWIEVHHQIILVNEWSNQFVTQTEIECKARMHFEIVLEKDTRLAVGNIKRRTSVADEQRGVVDCRRHSQQERGKAVKIRAPRQSPARVVAV